MARSADLYFHSPCFDGIVSGVLAWEFLESVRGWKVERFRPVDYSSRGKWLKATLHTPSAVVDFLYHPQAQFWADHHVTTFLTKGARKHFDRRRGDLCLSYNDRIGSCALLLWEHLLDAFDFRNPRYREMVQWADKIDSARYDSVEEAILGDTPALRIRASLAPGEESEEYTRQLVQLLRYSTLEEVAELPKVRRRSDRIRFLVEAGLERFGNAARLEDGEIVVFDVDSRDVIVSRYAPYFFFPQARYSVGIVRTKEGAKITAMRNPWRDFPSAPLGSIFASCGGGGHERVGALLLPGSRAAKANRIREYVLQEIRGQDPVRQTLRPTA